MSTKFLIKSTDPVLLEKATRIAKEFVQKHMSDDIVGIVFLGAIARGYFDQSADIDIAIFKKQGSEISLTKKFYKIEGLEVQIWLSDYENELTNPWDMAKRWTYTQAWIYFDPQDKISQLLKEKVPLKPEEKKWLMMAGLTLSEWYINRLTQLWLERGNIISAHHMFDQGLIFFFDMLFGLNNELVADMKWRYYCVEQLERLPEKFQERIKDIMILHSFTIEELERRKKLFMEIWREMQPIIENEVQMTFEEMEQIL
jgi:predicted nucleotidyltransferase